MRILPSALFVLALALTGCSSGVPFSSSSGGEETTSADAATSTTAQASDASSTGAASGDSDGSDDAVGMEDVSDETEDTSDEGEVTIEPREARDDLTDPYCVDLESVFAASYNIEVSTANEATADDFGRHLVTYAEAVANALEHAPAEHQQVLLDAEVFANTYANLSLAEAEQEPNFTDDFDNWFWLFVPDYFAEDVEEADLEDPAYLNVHAELLCGIDTSVTYSFDFGEDSEFDVEINGEYSSELGELSEYGVEIDDIVFSCTVTGQREFEVDLSNSLTETLSFSGEVVFFDAAGEPTSGRSTFYATSVRPGERSAEIQESDDPTSDSCEIDHMSWVRSANVPVEPLDICSFSLDDSTLDIELEVAGSDEAGDWINVRYGLSDADGVRRHSGLLTLENEPGEMITASTFDLFIEDDRFATCEIVEKELL